MKKTCSLTVQFCALFCLIATFASATPKTWNVRQDGTGDASTVGAAANLASPGDTINITQFTANFNEGSSITLNGVNLTSSLNPQPTIMESAPDANFAGSFVYVKGATPCQISNVKFLGYGQTATAFEATATTISVPNTGACFITYTHLTLNNVTIAGFDTALWGGATDTAFGYGGPLRFDVSQCFIVNCNTSVWITCVPAADTIESALNFTHNTFTAKSFCLNLDKSYADAGLNCSEITFKDNYVYTQFGRGISLGGYYNAVNNAAGAQNDAVVTPNLSNFKNNAFVNYWMYAWDCPNSATPNVAVEATLDPSNILLAGNNNPAYKLYRSLTNADFTVPQSSKLTNAADDGTDIGANLTSVAGQFVGDYLVRQDGQGDYTNLTDALTAQGSSGQVIQIQQFSTAFVEPKALNLTNGTTLICVTGTTGQLATIQTSSDPKNAVINTGDGTGQGLTTTLENLIIDAQGNPTAINNFINGGGPLKIKNCMVKHSTYSGVSIFHYMPFSNAATITGSYFLNCKSAISFSDWTSTGYTLTFSNSLIDHCTFDNDNTCSGSCIEINANLIPAMTASSLTLSNNIFKIAYAYGQGCICSDGMQPTLNLSYNDYLYPAATEKRSTWHTNAGLALVGPFALGAGELDNVNPLFTDEAAGDYSLKAGSALFDAGSNQTNIGVWQGKPVAAAKTWKLFN